MAKTQNTAPVQTANANAAADDMPDFSTWTDRQIGFAPYWTPVEGESMFGKIVAVDMRDPEFVRYQFICLQPELLCHRGPVEGGEEVMVKKGDTFSMSVYSQLADEMLFHLESGISPPTKITAKTKSKTATVGRTVWNFRCQVSNEDDAKLRVLQPAWQKSRALGMSGVGTAATERPKLDEQSAS